MRTSIKLRLFVSGCNPAGLRAIENLNVVCNDPAVTREYDINIDIIDVNESPGTAEEDDILATPTLLKKLPLPVRRVVGDLSNDRDIFITIDIEPPHRA